MDTGRAVTPTAARFHGVPDVAALEQVACERILAAAGRALSARERFVLVLSGGSTPNGVYAKLRHSHADWSGWHVYFGDERCLPADHAERNSRAARALWLDHVAIPPAQVHVMAAELGAERGAQAVREALRHVGEFDLVLLGLGEDGHTASLFPGHDMGAAHDAPDALAIHDAPKPPPERVSLSAARLSRAREVMFLVAGAAKRNAVARWLDGEDLPAAAIRPASGVDVLLTASLLP